jgi:hypothetical protein
MESDKGTDKRLDKGTYMVMGMGMVMGMVVKTEKGTSGAMGEWAMAMEPSAAPRFPVVSLALKLW